MRKYSGQALCSMFFTLSFTSIAQMPYVARFNTKGCGFANHHPKYKKQYQYWLL